VKQPGEVAADADIHRLALPQRRRNRRVDLLVRVVQIGHHGLNLGTKNPADQEPLLKPQLITAKRKWLRKNTW
jgi:hypothetical protein